MGKDPSNIDSSDDEEHADLKAARKMKEDSLTSTKLDIMGQALQLMDLSNKCSKEEIKQAYRLACKKWHSGTVISYLQCSLYAQ